MFLGHSGGLDTDGNELPRLIYVSREKRPGFQHHKKAGAMNALVCHSQPFFSFTIFSLKLSQMSSGLLGALCISETHHVTKVFWSIDRKSVV